jgi:hypothetical protein
MMAWAEMTGSLAPEQYGSRKGHKAIDLAINKVLTYDILCHLKRLGAICSNDAKSCYNLIGHAQASIAMQRNGAPKAAVDCLFSTLQHTTHQVRTGLGDSTTYYGGSCWLIPLHGISLGNGVGPAIWAVVSTSLLNILRKKGYGCDIIKPISGKRHKFVGYAFVDDMDLVASKAGTFDTKIIRDSLQASLDTWVGTPKASCRAIVTDRTFWFLIDLTGNPKTI